MAKKTGTVNGSRKFQCGGIELLDSLNVNCINAFTTFHFFELNPVVFTNFFQEAAVVYEYLFFCFVRYNEAIAFGLIEELYSSGFHVVIN